MWRGGGIGAVLCWRCSVRASTPCTASGARTASTSRLIRAFARLPAPSRNTRARSFSDPADPFWWPRELRVGLTRTDRRRRSSRRCCPASPRCSRWRGSSCSPATPGASPPAPPGPPRGPPPSGLIPAAAARERLPGRLGRGLRVRRAAGGIGLGPRARAPRTPCRWISAASAPKPALVARRDGASAVRPPSSSPRCCRCSRWSRSRPYALLAGLSAAEQAGRRGRGGRDRAPPGPRCGGRRACGAARAPRRAAVVGSAAAGSRSPSGPRVPLVARLLRARVERPRRPGARAVSPAALRAARGRLLRRAARGARRAGAAQRAVPDAVRPHRAAAARGAAPRRGSRSARRCSAPLPTRCRSRALLANALRAAGVRRPRRSRSGHPAGRRARRLAAGRPRPRRRASRRG